jgi:PAS domain-containing protein
MFHLFPLSLLFSVACCFALHGIWLSKLRRKQCAFITHRWTQLHERAVILGSELSNQASALKSAQQELQRSDSLLSDAERCFHKLFHSATLPLSICQIEDGIFLDVNRAFARQVGRPESELIGKSLNELDRWQETGGAEVLAEVRAGKPLDSVVFFLTKSDRSQLVLQCSDRIQFEGNDCLLLEISRSSGQA